jgi:hypothetical protein
MIRDPDNPCSSMMQQFDYRKIMAETASQDKEVPDCMAVGNFPDHQKCNPGCI